MHYICLATYVARIFPFFMHIRYFHNQAVFLIIYAILHYLIMLCFKNKPVHLVSCMFIAKLESVQNSIIRFDWEHWKEIHHPWLYHATLHVPLSQRNLKYVLWNTSLSKEMLVIYLVSKACTQPHLSLRWFSQKLKAFIPALRRQQNYCNASKKRYGRFMAPF